MAKMPFLEAANAAPPTPAQTPMASPPPGIPHGLGGDDADGDEGLRSAFEQWLEQQGIDPETLPDDTYEQLFQQFVEQQQTQGMRHAPETPPVGSGEGEGFISPTPYDPAANPLSQVRLPPGYFESAQFNTPQSFTEYGNQTANNAANPPLIGGQPWYVNQMQGNPGGNVAYTPEELMRMSQQARQIPDVPMSGVAVGPQNFRETNPPLPENLYHTTPYWEDIERSGTLNPQTSANADRGGLGGATRPGVSFASNPTDALNIRRFGNDMVSFTTTAANGRVPDFGEILMRDSAVYGELPPDIVRATMNINWDMNDSLSRQTDEWSRANTAAQAYRSYRQLLDRANIVPDPQFEGAGRSYAGQPQWRTFEVPSRNITGTPGSSWGFGVDPGEIRTGNTSVPVRGSTLYGFAGITPALMDLIERDIPLWQQDVQFVQENAPRLWNQLLQNARDRLPQNPTPSFIDPSGGTGGGQDVGSGSALSLQNAGWVPPVDPGSVVGTGNKWLEPVSMEGTHKAVDLQAYKGTPTVSPITGAVSRVQNNPEGLGLQVAVDDGNVEHILAHLDSANVSPGQRVGAGQQVGRVGESGAGATGPHLDYRIKGHNGQYYDPSPLLGQLAQLPRADTPQDNPFGSGQQLDPEWNLENQGSPWPEGVNPGMAEYVAMRDRGPASTQEQVFNQIFGPYIGQMDDYYHNLEHSNYNAALRNMMTLPNVQPAPGGVPVTRNLAGHAQDWLRDRVQNTLPDWMRWEPQYVGGGQDVGNHMNDRIGSGQFSFGGGMGMGGFGGMQQRGGYGGMQGMGMQGMQGGMQQGGGQARLPQGTDFRLMFSQTPTLEGMQKWSGGGNSTDVFTRKGAPLLAPFDGYVSGSGGVMGQGGPVLTDPRTGFSVRISHGQPITQGQVHKGQPFATVNDPSMDQLRWPGGQYGQAPGGYQHAQVDFANSPQGFGQGPMSSQFDALSLLRQGGFQPDQMLPRTPGPPEGMGMGGGMGGNPFGGGGPPMGMPGGSPMGMPGMGMGMSPGRGMGMPGMPGQGMGMGMGMPGMGMPGMGMGMGGAMGMSGMMPPMSPWGGLSQMMTPMGNPFGDAMPMSPGMQRGMSGAPPPQFSMGDFPPSVPMSGMGTTLPMGPTPFMGEGGMSGMPANMIPSLPGGPEMGQPYGAPQFQPMPQNPWGIPGMGGEFGTPPYGMPSPYGVGQDVGSGQSKRVGSGQFGFGSMGGFGMGGQGGGMQGGMGSMGMGGGDPYGQMSQYGGGGGYGDMGGDVGGQISAQAVGPNGQVGGLGGAAPMTAAQTKADEFMQGAINWKPDMNARINSPFDAGVASTLASLLSQSQGTFAPWLSRFGDSTAGITPPGTTGTTGTTTGVEANGAQPWHTIPGAPTGGTNPLTTAEGIPWATLYPAERGPYIINGINWNPTTQRPPWETAPTGGGQDTNPFGSGQDRRVGSGQYGGNYGAGGYGGGYGGGGYGGYGGGGGFGGTSITDPGAAVSANNQQQSLQAQIAQFNAQFGLSQQQQQASMIQMQNAYEQAKAQLKQQWLVHQDDAYFQQQMANLNARFQQASQNAQYGQQGQNNLLSLFGNAQQQGLQRELANQQNAQYNQNFGLNVANQAVQQQQAGFGRQMQMYNSSLQNPWLQQLAGLAPAWNAPGGPAQAGQAAAQGWSTMNAPGYGPISPPQQQVGNIGTDPMSQWGNTWRSVGTTPNFNWYNEQGLGSIGNTNIGPWPTYGGNEFSGTPWGNLQPPGTFGSSSTSSGNTGTGDPNTGSQFTGGGQDVGSGEDPYDPYSPPKVGGPYGGTDNQAMNPNGPPTGWNSTYGQPPSGNFWPDQNAMTNYFLGQGMQQAPMAAPNPWAIVQSTSGRFGPGGTDNMTPGNGVFSSYGAFSQMSPFEQAAQRTGFEMAGIPWAQAAQGMRTQWGNNGQTAPPQMSRLAYQNVASDPLKNMSLGNTLDVFGTNQQNYVQGQAPQWSQSNQNSVSMFA